PSARPFSDWQLTTHHLQLRFRLPAANETHREPDSEGHARQECEDANPRQIEIPKEPGDEATEHLPADDRQDEPQEPARPQERALPLRGVALDQDDGPNDRDGAAETAGPTIRQAEQQIGRTRAEAVAE